MSFASIEQERGLQPIENTQVLRRKNGKVFVSSTREGTLSSVVSLQASME